MPSAILWDASPSLTTVGSTALNSLAPAASSGPLTEIDNSTGLFPWVVFDLVLGAAYACGATDPRADLYLVYAVDGTNYPDPPGSGTGAIPGGFWAGAITGVPSANFTRGHSKPIPLMPFKVKPIIVNNLNTTGNWNATGNTLAYGRWAPESQ